jgi:hypothetical protein
MKAEIRIWSRIGDTPLTGRAGSYCDELAHVNLEVGHPLEAQRATERLLLETPHAYNGHYSVPDHPNQNLRKGWVNRGDAARAAMRRDAQAVPVDTPWGRAITRERVAPGLWVVTTASHGGYYVEPSALDRIPEVFRAATFTRSESWYEEDCDWAIVARYFPEAFPPEAQDHAEAVLRRYHTRAMALTPTPNPPGWTVID